MTDALCSPSNALQTFQKQVGSDRTLQQDRLARRHVPNQGFRSSPGLNTGILDAEFEAFQTGHPLNSGFQERNLYQQGALGQHAYPPPMQQELPGWASDFQRLNLNAEQSFPISPSQFRHEAPLQRSTSGGWHQEFLQQQAFRSNQQSSMPQRYSGAGGQQQWPQTQPFSGFSTNGNQLSYNAQQKQPERLNQDVFDEAAFESAFDAARMEIMEAESNVMNREAGLGQDISLNDSELLHRTREDQSSKVQVGSEESNLLNGISFPTMTEGERKIAQEEADATVHGPFDPSIEALSYPDDLMAEQMRQSTYLTNETPNETLEARSKNDADELSRTAGQLLDHLKHEQSQKFQQSTFLALMRQLRDKEIRVEGDKMINITQPLHPGGPYYPDGAPVMSGAIDETSQAATQEDATA